MYEFHRIWKTEFLEVLELNLAVDAFGIETFCCIEFWRSLFASFQNEGVFSSKAEASHVLRYSNKIAQQSLFIAAK